MYEYFLYNFALLNASSCFKSQENYNLVKKQKSYCMSFRSWSFNYGCLYLKWNLIKHFINPDKPLRLNKSKVHKSCFKIQTLPRWKKRLHFLPEKNYLKYAIHVYGNACKQNIKYVLSTNFFFVLTFIHWESKQFETKQAFNFKI